MQQTAASENTIPQHVLERLESEWRQMADRRDREQAPTSAERRERVA
jgi:hypothetical protein